MRNTADVTGGKPIAVLLQSISGVNAINPLVAFYDIHGGEREVPFFYSVPDTTREIYTRFDSRFLSQQWGIAIFVMLGGRDDDIGLLDNHPYLIDILFIQPLHG
jgi:hypothetical protein